MFLGDLGGLMDIIWVTGGWITAFLTMNSFLAELIKDSYLIQRYNHDTSEYYPTF